jgi:hypothetical protein
MLPMHNTVAACHIELVSLIPSAQQVDMKEASPLDCSCMKEQ